MSIKLSCLEFSCFIWDVLTNKLTKGRKINPCRETKFPLTVPELTCIEKLSTSVYVEPRRLNKDTGGTVLSFRIHIFLNTESYIK